MNRKILYTYSYYNKFFAYGCIEDIQYVAHNRKVSKRWTRCMEDWNWRG